MAEERNQSYRCACHESSVKVCPRHGTPLKLKEGERVVQEHDLTFLQLCVDPKKGEEFAQRVREVLSGRG